MFSVPLKQILTALVTYMLTLPFLSVQGQTDYSTQINTSFIQNMNSSIALVSLENQGMYIFLSVSLLHIYSRVHGTRRDSAAGCDFNVTVLDILLHQQLLRTLYIVFFRVDTGHLSTTYNCPLQNRCYQGNY